MEFIQNTKKLIQRKENMCLHHIWYDVPSSQFICKIFSSSFVVRGALSRVVFSVHICLSYHFYLHSILFIPMLYHKHYTNTMTARAQICMGFRYVYRSHTHTHIPDYSRNIRTDKSLITRPINFFVCGKLVPNS